MFNSTNIRILDENDPFDFSYFKNLLGLFGNILAIFFFIAPISIMIKLHKKQQDPKDTPFLLFIATCLNCTFWTSYGILKTKNKFFILLCNSVGLPLNYIYFCFYLFYRFDRKCGKSLLYMIGSGLFLGGVLSIWTYAIKLEIVSQYSAMIFNVILFATPGQNIVKVCKTNDNSLIPLPSTIMCLIASLDWFFYGFLVLDPAIMVPNGLGVLFSIINLSIYIAFRNKKIKIDEEKETTEKCQEEKLEKEEKLEVIKLDKDKEEKLDVKDTVNEDYKEKDINNQTIQSSQSDKISIELNVKVVKEMKNTL